MFFFEKTIAPDKRSYINQMCLQERTSSAIFSDDKTIAPARRSYTRKIVV
jgi:hypothetical protein